MPATMQREERIPVNPLFGEAVESLLGGMSNNDGYKATGINHMTIRSMRQGIVPGYRTLERFADGMKLAPRARTELFRAAGYSPKQDALSLFMAGVQRLAGEIGEPVMVSTEEAPAEDATEEEVKRCLALVRRRVKKKP